MSFYSPDSGYVSLAGAGYGRTFDGGKSWKIYTVRKGQDSAFEDICFVSGDTGIICGRFGMLYRTVDGCKMWESIWLPDNDKTPWLTSVALMHGGGGVMVGLKPGQPPTGVGYRTEDAGKTWSKIDVKGLAFGEIFYRPGEPICFQSWGRLNYSIDQGKTWG
ncbi:MAG: YCF48-related protein, partial [Candidatus Zixiibacteriota bacterium]